MDIRKAVEEDVPKIRELVVSLIGFFLKSQCPQSPRWLEETLTEKQYKYRIGSSEHINLVAISDGTVVGYVCLKINGHLYHLFVSERYQGNGIGRALWQKASDLCPLSSYFVRASLNAVPVYKRFGFLESAAVSEKEGVQFQPMELGCSGR